MVPVTTGLVVDLVASKMGDVDGSTVYSWQDGTLDGRGNAFYANGDYAIYRRNLTPNGGPAIRFYNAQYSMQNPWIYDSSTSAEFFIVLRTDGVTNEGPGPFQWGGNDYTYYTFNDGNLYDGSFTNSRYSFPFSTPSNWHIYNVSHDGTTRTVRIDGVVVHTVNVAFTPPTQAGVPNCYLGRQFQNYPWGGDLAEVVAYNKVLSSAERANVYNFLRSSHFDVVVAGVAMPPLTVQVTTPALTATDPLVPLVMPPLRVSVALATTLPEPVQLTMPALNVAVALSMGDDGDALIVPPIAVGITVLSMSFDSISLTLSTPPDGGSVATVTPGLVVAVVSDDSEASYTVEVQYADTIDFTGAVTLTKNFDAVDGGAILTPSSPVPATTFWRARLLQDGNLKVNFTPARSFTVNVQVDPTGLPVTWTVDSSADRPIHLWHLSPAGPVIGDTVTAYGQGFPASGHVTFGDLDLPVTSWTLVAADEDNQDDTTRLINDDTITCEHYEVTFVAPNYDGPGAALTVEA